MAVGTNTKPYRLQDPQRIAMEYGGDKQKIARAMQLGIIDPTAGTLAGMFIDKMRSAAQAEQQSQMTVAQKTFAPPAPPQGVPPEGAPPQGAPPQGAPAGLGATPEAAQMGQMLPPQGGAPMPPQSPEQMQPMNMAEGGLVAFGGGGLSDLPVPDTMFDENRNGGFDDGYAGGGIVAFAPGGPASARVTPSNLDQAYARILQLEGGLGPNGQMLTSSAGAIGPAQLLPSTARDAARMAGLTWDDNKFRTDPTYNTALGKAYYASRVAARGGDFAKAALDYHTGMGNVEKGIIGPRGRKYLSDFTGGAPAPAGMAGAPASGAPAGMAGAPAGMAGMPTAEDYGIGMKAPSITDLYKTMRPDVEKMFSPPERKYSDAARTALEKEIAPEAIAKQDKQDFWMHIFKLGTSMMATKSPDFLGAAGESLQSTLGDYQKLKKEHRDEYRKNLASLAGIEDASNKDKRALEGLALGIVKDQAGLLNENQRDQLAARGRRANDTVQFGLGQLQIAAQNAREAVGNATSITVANINQGGADRRAAEAAAIKAATPPNMTDANRKTLSTQLTGLVTAAGAADKANNPDEVRRIMTEYYRIKGRADAMAEASGFAPIDIKRVPLTNYAAGVNRGKYPVITNPSLGAGANGAPNIAPPPGFVIQP